MPKKMAKEEFIKKAKEIHGDKYDYSKAEYVNNSTNISIICPNHGIFQQNPKNHLNGFGCKKCTLEKKALNKKDVIDKLNKIYNNKYDYSLLHFNSTKNKIKVICPEHGEFEKTLEKHLYSNQGCPKCSGYKMDKDKFIKKASIIHNNKYDYSKVEEVRKKDRIKIICPEHGEFEQTVDNHLQGKGCAKCANNTKKDIYSFVEKAKIIHGLEYDYSKSHYDGLSNKVEILCKEHGSFFQTPINHLRGTICPKCSKKIIISKSEEEINTFLAKYTKVETSNRDILSGKELDIYLPELKLAIEFNGLYWHSYDRLELKEEKERHLYKTEECEKQGIQLIHINEDEWLFKKQIVKSILSHKLGNSRNRIYARKCKVKEIDPSDYNKFCEVNHIQGKRNSKIKLGLFYDSELLSVMGFNIHSKYQWELIRYCQKQNCSVIGGASKIWKYFIKNYKPDSILSFCDRRWSDGRIYHKLGMKMIELTPPNYKYVKNKQFLSRLQCQKHKLSRLLDFFDHNKTEYENMFINGYRRIWDCGNYKFVWRKENAR